jgi:hypothetical protein
MSSINVYCLIGITRHIVIIGITNIAEVTGITGVLGYINKTFK